MWRKCASQYKVVVAVTMAASFLSPGCVARAADSAAMTLRINDAAAEPGGVVAVVLRTYAPRGVEQGQICLRAASQLKAAGAPAPFAMLEEAVVFSDAGDTVSVSTFDGPGQTALVEFTSPSGSVNLSDGPLAVFFFRIESDLAGGEEFLVELDLAATFLVAAGNQGVAIEPRAGVLSIRPPGAPRHFGAEGDSVLPGEVAVLEAQTWETFAVSGGQVTFLYDAAFAAGPPEVVMEPRHGSSEFTVDTGTPGRVVVSFTSADSSLNRVPGAIVSLLLPTSPALPVGRWSVVELDPASTWLDDPLGRRIDLELTDDVLELGGEAAIFVDGFESGDISGWVPGVSP